MTQHLGPSGFTRKDPEPHQMQGLLDYVTEEMLLEEASTEIGFLTSVLDQEKLNMLSPSGSFKWDIYQEVYFKNKRNYACNKCRQSGGSTMGAAKKTARGVLASGLYTAIMISYKKEEAIGKIDYVRRFLNTLPPSFKKKERRSPRQLIEFDNNNGTTSKIISHPQRPVRGETGEAFVDELAFYQHDQEVFQSLTPVTSQSGGDIDVVSTPFGKGGVYYEIMSDPEKAKRYTRVNIMWWHCLRYLKIPDVDYMFKVAKVAPYLGSDIERRVMAFGSEALINQFESALDLDSFRQEFEGYFVDESAVFFYRDLIISCMYHRHSTMDDYDGINDDDFEDGWTAEDALAVEASDIEKHYAGLRDVYGNEINFKKYFNETDKRGECYGTKYDLYHAIQSGEISDNIVAGLDIGTTNHSTDFRILEEVELTDGRVLQIERGSISHHDWPLPDQQDFFETIIEDGFINKIHADCTGIGMQMGQYLSSRYPSIFVDLQMGGDTQKQERYMVNLKNRMESRTIGIEFDKTLMEDLYGIERHISDSKRISYKASEKKRRHSDGAWALAYASYAGTPYQEFAQDIDPSTLALRKDTFKETKQAMNRVASHFALEDFHTNGDFAIGGLEEFDGIESVFGIGNFNDNYDL